MVFYAVLRSKKFLGRLGKIYQDNVFKKHWNLAISTYLQSAQCYSDKKLLNAS